MQFVAMQGEQLKNGRDLKTGAAGVLAAAGLLTVVPGLVVVWFVRKHLVQGFTLGRVN